MDVLKIPFVQHIGIEKDNNNLILRAKEHLQNHVGTIHASALFTLAETQSGLHLQRVFEQLDKSAIPLLRSSNVKYKNPATKDLIATATIKDEDKEKFLSSFNRRGRGFIKIIVEIKDIDNIDIMSAEFEWYIQKIKG